MQIRFIDSEGLEKIRAQRDEISSQAYLVKGEKLQNKSERDYFSKSKSQELKNIWYSNIDLNIENKKVEKPYKATLRIILPIQKDNSFAGILVMNYFMKNKLDRLLNSEIFDMLLVNNKGFILRHFDNSKNWSFYNKENKYTLKMSLEFYQKIF